MLVLRESVVGLHAEVCRNAANRQIHFSQFERGGRTFLPVNRNVLRITVVALHKLHRLHKHSSRAAAGVVNLPLVGLDQLRNQVDNALGRVEFALSFAFSQCEVAQEIFIDPPHDIL